uniref:Ig-like domain-containing protein n=1 Tax=Gadus morhua TaxID=8049 RepID=A0A8C5FTS3_GADMO
MSGCEWDDEDDTTYGHEQYAYDGEDFLAFDLKTLTWVAAVRQAVPSKLRLDQNRAGNQRKKNYLTKECVDLLKKLLAYGKSTLQRTERPRVSLLQRSPSSPVVCHATGFYPDRVVVFWRRDGQELHEQVDPGEVLPNHDGTFQVSVDLDLTAVPQEDWGSCSGNTEGQNPAPEAQPLTTVSTLPLYNTYSRQGKARQLYLYSTFHTQGRLKVLHI